LVWFEHPEGSFTSGNWKEHIVVNGPDVLFDVYLNTPQELILIFTEFFGKELTAVSILKSDPYKANYRRVIDKTIGAAYSVKIVDLNNNGKNTMVVTNHEGTKETAAMYAYEMPAPNNVRDGEFKRYTLREGYETRQWGNNEASPVFFIPN
jgi:hypothetical protein